MEKQNKELASGFHPKVQNAELESTRLEQENLKLKSRAKVQHR